MGTGGIPNTMPTEFVDRSVYLGVRAGVYRPELGGVVSFSARLDEDRLRRAMRLLLDVEPVLGCLGGPKRASGPRPRAGRQRDAGVKGER